MTAQRFVALDILRGIAIVGTLGTNIWIFTNVEGLAGYLAADRLASGGWAVAEAVLQQLTQGKFLGLLTIMFGIGLAIQQRSARRRGRPWPGKYPWRAALLFLDGMINYLLFAEFDVLMGYAVTGLIVAYLLTMSLRRQRLAIITAAGIHVALLAVIALALAGAGPERSSTPTLTPNPYADGSFWELMVFRLESAALFRAEVIFILPMSIALFLVGAALLRAGILEHAGAALRRRLMVVGFGIALPLDFLAGLAGGDVGIILGRYGFAPVVALAILAGIAEFYVSGRQPGAVARALAPIGRMALTCYVLQNALAGLICYGWGFGLAARLTPDTVVPATVGLWCALTAALIVGSRWWLARWERGPLEWLWHRSYQWLAGPEELAARNR